MQTLLPGKHNPRVIDLRKAIDGATLTRDGLLPIEGPKLLKEALRSNIEILDVFLQRDIAPELPQLSDRIRIFELDPATFRAIQTTETSQGVIALVRPPEYSLDRILSVKKPRIVILARLQDPGNAGTILRIAEGFGATACLGLTGTVSIYNSKTVRASAGSVFRMPHVWNLSLSDLVPEMRRSGIKIAGSSPTASNTVESWEWNKATAILIGNEGGGLSEDEMRACDAMLRIPHDPAVESLNSAISAAIFLYEASRGDRTREERR